MEDFNKYLIIHETVIERLKNGEITVEQAKEVNDLAFKKYITKTAIKSAVKGTIKDAVDTVYTKVQTLGKKLKAAHQKSKSNRALADVSKRLQETIAGNNELELHLMKLRAAEEEQIKKDRLEAYRAQCDKYRKDYNNAMNEIDQVLSEK